MQYKILINNRDYNSWILYDADTLQEVNKINIYPEHYKLFSSDIFEYNDENKIILLHSSVRNMPILPGVLVLSENKTYGKVKDKFLYKCIPDDKRIPSFLIPYQLKIGFSKKVENKYIVFKFNHWDNKHPQGTIVSVLGDVNKLENFYEYQLYCKSLYASIQPFNKAVSKALKEKTQEEFINNIIKKNNLLDRTHEKIYSIDSKETTDYDDAFSITDICENSYKLSIYIANVPLWMNELDLWESFSQRISTIYLPDRKRPMLPTILSECLCSLCENELRVAFCLDIFIKENEIIAYNFENVYIKLYKNHVYNSKELKADNNYKIMYKIVDKLSYKYKYTSKIKCSNDMVCYLMILMNYYSACEMIKFNNGIYRSVTVGKNKIFPNDLPDDMNTFLTHWNSSCGQYNLFDNKKCHDFLELESYIHVTSPIRRLVDLLNMARLQLNLNMIDYKESFLKFYDNWTNQIDYINTTMRAIRKIQIDCNLLDLCTNNPQYYDEIQTGYVFDKIIRNDGLYQYVVYLTKIKMVSRMTLRYDLNEYSIHKFKIYLFNDESTLKKKIRLQFIEN